MGRVILHIGLHKTATRFLQRALFKRLDPDWFVVNPRKIMQPLESALKYGSTTAVHRFVDAAHTVVDTIGDKRLIVSDPNISGNMFNNHIDYRDNLALMREAFPDAKVLYFVRRQTDWLHSAYRQALVKGRSASIETFLNFRDGQFHRRPARRVDRMRTLDALDLRFLDIYRAYAEAYAPENVYLLRQEDLRERPEDVYIALAHTLGLEHLPTFPRRVSSNRAYSALAIRLFHPGTFRTPDIEEAALSDEAHGENARSLIRSMRKLRTLFIRHLFDRLIYVDWDLIAEHGMRERLEEYYANENRRLEKIAATILDDGPGPRALAKAGPSGANTQDAPM